MTGMHLDFNKHPEEFLAHLTHAAYQVVLKHGFTAPFIDLELEMHDALRQVIKQDMKIAQLCGEPVECKQAPRLQPWSAEAIRLYKEAF